MPIIFRWLRKIKVTCILIAILTVAFVFDIILIPGIVLINMKPVRQKNHHFSSIDTSLVKQGANNGTLSATKPPTNLKSKEVMKTSKVLIISDISKPVLANQSLESAVGSDLLKPGSEAEVVARRLMDIRRQRIVNPHNYSYRINPKHMCSNKTVEVVLCVVSAVQNLHARQRFRYSIKGGYAGIWNAAHKAVLVFFLGLPSLPNASSLQKKIKKESALYGDIVQGSYIDSYRNLSLKTVSILKWVSVYCSGARFVLKTDDDCDVNIPLMMTKLRNQQEKEPVYMLGKISRKLTPLRDQKSKWYIPYSLYKEERYPTFMYGGSQGYPTPVASLLYEASLRIPLFWLEDVYISGLCASMAKIPRYDTAAFYFSHFPPPGETEY